MIGLSNPIKLLLVVVAGYFLYKMFSNDKKFKKKATQSGQGGTTVSDDMVKDPICGSYVSKDGDIRVRNGNQVLCFCSFECRDKYVKQLKAGAAQNEQVQSGDNSSAAS